jgi:SRSO17 transposase
LDDEHTVCQVAVSLSVATHEGSLPVAYRLYLPKEWADDAGRRSIAGVPDDVGFQTKPEIALQQLREALADGVSPAPVLMDPAYGNDSKLRVGIGELRPANVAGILPTTTVWRLGEAPVPPASEQVAAGPAWRDGSNTPLTSRFARWRVRPAHDGPRRSEPAAEEWLLIEWPENPA